ncbi:MAG TPA: sulfatase [Myxococcota bacterium]|nr:sulfatase [Myxococcota bacterium]
MQRLRAIAIAAAVALACSAESGSPPASAARPNVVVITIDTLRPDHLDLYGYARETAPFLRSLGAKSVVFRNAYSSSSWTAPATASLFTSLYPNQHGVMRGFVWERSRISKEQEQGGAKIAMNTLPADVPTLGEVFHAAGYRTFALTANINVGPEIGFARGFDRFERLSIANGKRVFPDAEQVLRHLVSWIGEIRGAGPYFLYLHFNDPHGPLERRQPWFGEPGPREGLLAQEYDSEISYVDSFVRRVDEFLELGRGITVVLSDHGQAFGEHGELGHGPNTGLFGEVNRIVLMISAPARGIRPGESTAVVSIVDVLPTLCELAGLPAPAGARGASLVPLLAPGDPSAAQRFADRAVLAHVVGDRVPEPTRAVIRGQWKLVHGHSGTALYDLARDPREERDVAEDHREIAEALEAELAREPAPRSGGETIDVKLDGADLERLKKLGYAE